MVEIERKFLVKYDTFKTEAFKKTRILQGFLNSDAERTVRVRIKGDKAYLTVKGKSNEAGTVRMEWETKISVSDAKALLKIAEKGQIEKIRYEVKTGNHIFEVDEFFGTNEGLVIAEIELSEENENFDKPEWLGKEVTGDVRYYNSQLSKNPFKKWN